MANPGKTYSVLVIDDDKNISELIKQIFKKEKVYDVATVTNGEAALKYIREQIPDLVMLDIQMPGIDGIETLKRIKEYEPRIAAVMMSAHGSVERAVKSMKLGAYDFVSKPLDRDRLLITAKNALMTSSLEREVNELKSELKQKFQFDNIVGSSGAMKELFKSVENFEYIL